jgi:hypothetical protein
MKKLSVLYDLHCAASIRLRSWVTKQPKYLPVEFIPARSSLADRLFPGLSGLGHPMELVAVDDRGGVYRGTRAWIMCLFALKEYRSWALRLADPSLLPLAQRAVLLLSRTSIRVSRGLSRAPEPRIVEILSREGVPESRPAPKPAHMLKPYGHEFPET